MAHIRDMTNGRPARLMLSFALPMLLGNLFQQLYSMVDALVVGRGVGVQALAAVSATGSIDWMVLGAVLGLAQGFSILVAQRFGAGDWPGVRRAAVTAGWLSAAAGVLVTAVSVAFARDLLLLLRTPADILDASHTYIRIIFLGIPVVIFYNLLSGILRALGDSRTPLTAMVIASVTNIALDCLTVFVFGWGIAGVAAATVTSQLVSCLYCLSVLMRLPDMRLSRKERLPHPGDVLRLLHLGIPTALQNAITAGGGMVLQFIINGQGSLFVAGYGTAMKFCGLMEQAGVTFGFAMHTFAGQNLGAGKIDRIRKGCRECIGLTTAAAVLIGGAVLLFGRHLAGFIVEDAAAVEIAVQCLTVLAVSLPVLNLLFVYRSALQGMGDTVMPMLSGAVELVMRIGCALILPRFLGVWGIYIAEVSAWFGAEVMLMAVYWIRMARLRRQIP